MDESEEVCDPSELRESISYLQGKCWEFHRGFEMQTADIVYEIDK